MQKRHAITLVSTLLSHMIAQLHMAHSNTIKMQVLIAPDLCRNKKRCFKVLKCILWSMSQVVKIYYRKYGQLMTFGSTFVDSHILPINLYTIDSNSYLILLLLAASIAEPLYKRNL